MSWPFFLELTIQSPWFIFFSYSDVGMVVCLGSLSSCMTQIQPSWTDDIYFKNILECGSGVSMTRSFSNNETVKQAQIIAPVHHYAWQLVWVIYVEMLFMVFTKHHLIHNDCTSFWSKVNSCLFRCIFANINLAVYYFWKERVVL